MSTNSHLDDLENESIYILREAYAKYKRLALLWSIGKDSTVVLWLLQKALFRKCPIPVIHIDTSYKIPEMITYRDDYAKKWNLNLIIGQNKKALEQGMNHTIGKLECCTALKTNGLHEVIQKHQYQAVILGIRRDEEGTRAKERFFSPRDEKFEWDFKDQPPELWNQYQTEYPPDVHVRVHPLLHWTELDVWQYIEREKIPIIDLYFSKNGKRYRSIGCAPCTGQITSTASNVSEIVEELKKTKTAEREGRAQDKADPYAMQKLRIKGYM